MPSLGTGTSKLCLSAAALLVACAACDSASPENTARAPAVAPPPSAMASPARNAAPVPSIRTQEHAGPPLLLIPVQGVPASQLRDSFIEARGDKQRSHEALDIMAARGTPVLAVDDGRIVKLFLSKLGGVTLYQFDQSGRFAYYYAHMDRYADGIAEGQLVRRGSVIGYVGSTGNADPSAPHLHFAIFKLGPEKQWWKGEPINPFTYLGGQKP